MYFLREIAKVEVDPKSYVVSCFSDFVYPNLLGLLKCRFYLVSEFSGGGRAIICISEKPLVNASQ